MRIQLYTTLLCLSILLIACFRKEDDGKVSNPDVTDEQAIATQNHINTYFHRNIIPQIDSAWNAMADSGKTVTYHYTFLRKDSTWHFHGLERMESELTGNNDSVAIAIMSSAMLRSTFPVEQRLAKDSMFNVYWTWPVPFPEGEYDESTGVFMLKATSGGASGKGCDGYGARPHCTMCGPNSDCPLVCVGSLECSNQADGSCWAFGVCASGGPFSRVSVNLIQ